MTDLTKAYDKFQKSLETFIGYFIIIQSETEIFVDQLKNIGKYTDANKVSSCFYVFDCFLIS